MNYLIVWFSGAEKTRETEPICVVAPPKQSLSPDKPILRANCDYTPVLHPAFSRDVCSHLTLFPELKEVLARNIYPDDGTAMAALEGCRGRCGEMNSTGITQAQEDQKVRIALKREYVAKYNYFTLLSVVGHKLFDNLCHRYLDVKFLLYVSGICRDANNPYCFCWAYYLRCLNCIIIRFIIVHS